MASAYKIHLTVNDTGIVPNKPQTDEAAFKISELLQENHDKHHAYWGRIGFHNHIVHHLLTLYGVGAPASIIEQRYKENAPDMRPVMDKDDIPIENLYNLETFNKCLGIEKYYHSFLLFFQKEMEEKGWEKVLQEYVFAGDERADDLMGRLYDGFLHPLIHLGFGIEFNQPVIMCEGLAQAATHWNWTGKFLQSAEEAAKSNPNPTSKSMVELHDEIYADKKLSTAADWNDDNKVRDGILVRAPGEMMRIARQWIVTPENLEQKTAEMINSVIYFTAAAQRPPKQIRFDFYFMHCLNASIFFPTLNKLSWLSTANKVRLLQWKGHLDLAMYASRRSPPLLLEEIATYVPAKLERGDAEWPGIFRRLEEFKDDGHAIKLGRAVRNGELVAGKYGDVEWERIKGFMWEKIGNMVIDSVEDEGVTWVRSAGFDEAWVDYKDRPRQTSI
ncbi:Questin oxidase [Lachnellula suecica]|uniref:Questin oxidase n=1 Tax=Lachnellula suecica TaxID=602035 RepID=A0A8T9CKY2_9HELO|nr:Questin oxidase [Lachnellula suecica]